MSSADLGQLFDDLVRVETALWNAVNARLDQEHQLTLARFEVMRVVATTKPCRIQDIADRLVITWGGASKVVDRVAAAGHCRRRPNPADARSSLVTLTRSGRTVLQAASLTVNAELDGQLGPVLDGCDLSTFADTLRRLRLRSKLAL